MVETPPTNRGVELTPKTMPRLSPPYCEAYEASCDWITLSAPTQARRLGAFKERVGDLWETIKSENPKPQRFGMSGYEGEKFDGVSYGVRSYDLHACLVAHGHRADAIVQWAIENDLDAECKRFDASVLTTFRRSVPFYGEILRRATRKHQLAQGRTERIPFTLFEKAKQDTGAYLGSRGSAIFTRVYDSDLYHKGESNQTRFNHEVELTGVAAVNTWGKMREAENRAKLCAEIVTTRLKKEGICPKGIEHLELSPVSGTKQRSEFEVWFAWFQRSALPRAKREMLDGHAPEVKAALIKAGILTPKGCFAMPMDQAEIDLD